MINDVVRVGFLVLLGLALGIGVVSYVHYCYQEIRGTGQVVIDPLTVVEDNGRKNDDVGSALALMLQMRLESLNQELADAQAGLSMSAPSARPEGATARVGDVRLWTQDVALRTGLLQPIEMKLSVAGVEVGGLIPWLQRRLSNRRTLHFTVYHGNQTQVFGSVSALQLGNESVRLLIKGDDGKTPPAFDVIVDRLAHEIIRRRLAHDPSNRVGLLRPTEFMTLSGVLVAAAESNRNASSTQNDFADLVPRITTLSDQVPNWPELGYFAAWVADKARDSNTASSYYRRVIPLLDTTKQKDLVDFINHRLEILAAAEPATIAITETTEITKAAIDYTSDIKRVRDSGPEGSVVGQALATALEFQIAKATHQDLQLSPRYIYYAARQAAGTADMDSGAVIADAIRVLTKKGAVEESVWPYVAGQYAAKPPAAVETAKRVRITNAKSLKGLDAIKKALVNNGPVVAGIEVYQSAMNPEATKTGVIPMPAPKEQIIGGHAIVIVGFDDKHKRIKFVNSWGSSWGDHGFGYLSYDYVEKHLSDAWTFKAATA